jgi:hypothetical protein
VNYSKIYQGLRYLMSDQPAEIYDRNIPAEAEPVSMQLCCVCQTPCVRNQYGYFGCSDACHGDLLKTFHTPPVLPETK